MKKILIIGMFLGVMVFGQSAFASQKCECYLEGYSIGAMNGSNKGRPNFCGKTNILSNAFSWGRGYGAQIDGRKAHQIKTRQNSPKWLKDRKAEDARYRRIFCGY